MVIKNYLPIIIKFYNENGNIIYFENTKDLCRLLDKSLTFGYARHMKTKSSMPNQVFIGSC